MVENAWIRPICIIGMMLWVGGATGVGAEKAADLDKAAGQPAELSAWAYAYRADRNVQEKPEACFVLRRLQRLDQVYRPVSRLLSQGNPRKGSPPATPQGDWQLLAKKVVQERGELPPAPSGTLNSALLWEGRMHLNRLELHWPSQASAPPQPSVEVRVYPSPYGWFGWQWDQQVTVKPEVSGNGTIWTYRGDWDGTDMVAVFVRPAEVAEGHNVQSPAARAVPQIRAFGPEKWERIDVEIEWGFTSRTERADYDGRVEGFFGLLGKATPLPGDTGTALNGPNAWKSSADGKGRRGIALSLCCIRPDVERVNHAPRFPYGHPRDTRITVWTKAGSFTFLARDLDRGPILAPEYGFFVSKARGGNSARGFAAELAAANVKSVRERTRDRREATWEEAMREIKLPLLPPGTALPPCNQVPDPPMQVQVPESRWQDAWRMGCSQLKKGELTYMDLALEAPRPIHDMDLAGLHETAAAWLNRFLERPGALADGDFADGAGNFCTGKLFHNTAIIDVPDCPTYELVHNGGTGRILYDLAEHYFLTGDTAWFKKNQARMQTAAEWTIRQRTRYMNDVPNRESLWAAGLHPPQHIADCAWGCSEWKWYVNIDAWYCQGLRRFAEAMQDVDPDNAARYLAESEQYRNALQKAVDRAIVLAPVMRVGNGTYRSYIPPILYVRGPSIGQVVQIAMTDQDWSLQALDAARVPLADDVRVDGHLDVCEDVMALSTTYVHGGDRYAMLTARRRQRGLSPAEDWFWGGFAPQLGYTSLANVYLRRDEVPSFLRQWVNNYAAFSVPIPDYCFLEHSMNQAGPEFIELFKKKDYRAIVANPGYRNGHALSYFMEQFRNLLVWEDGANLWLAKATPRHWLEQGKTISVKNAPTHFGVTSYAIVSDVEHAKITATVEMPTRKAPNSVLLRFRHPKSSPIKSVTLNGKPWSDFDSAKEVIRLRDVKGTVALEAAY